MLARATRWSSASAATAGSSPARLYPEHKETRPLPGEEAPEARGRRRALPAVRRGRSWRPSAAGSARSSAARATRTATSSARTARRRPDQLPFEVTCPKNGDGHLVARRARRTGNVFWGCSNYPKCDFTTQRRADGRRSTTSTTDGKGAIARRGEAGLCLTCGAAVTLPEGVLVGPAAAGRPAGSRRRWTAGARRRRRRRRDASRNGTGPVGGRRARRAERRGLGPGRGATDRVSATPGRAVCARRGSRGGVTGRRRAPPVPALARGARHVAGHAPLVRDDRDGLPRLARRAHGADWRSPGRTTLRAYLADLTEGHAKSSVAQRLAALRAFHRYCAAVRARARRPVGRDRDARGCRAACRRVLEVEQVEALLAVVDDDLDRSTRRRRAPTGRARRAATPTSRARSRCATARSSRRRMRRACGSASSRRRTSATLDLRRGRDARPGQGAQGADRAARAARARGARRLPRRGPARSCSPRRRRSPSAPTAVFLNHHGAAARRPRAARPPRPPAPRSRASPRA